MSKTIYVAGPMRGIRHFNFPAFDAARDRLAALGWNVISPADLDREIGFDEKAFPDDYDWIDLKKIGFSIQDAVERDVEVLIRSEAIYMLHGWEKSKGATAEKAIAEWLGLEVIYEGVEEYRYLEVGEVILESDEVLKGEKWVATNCAGSVLENRNAGQYRRKVVTDPPKPPKVATVDPGEGYRLVEVGEVLEKGDEFLFGGEWVEAISIGLKADRNGTWRRKIAEPEYRFLEIGEVIEEGDEVVEDGPFGDQWVPSVLAGVKIDECTRPKAYRRKVAADSVEQVTTYTYPVFDPPPPNPPQEDILEEALRITRGDRQAQYGPPDQDFRRSAGMLTALFADSLLREGAKFEPFHIAQMMILLKMSRQLHQRKRDNWVDIAGYARCGAICDEVAK